MAAIARPGVCENRNRPMSKKLSTAARRSLLASHSNGPRGGTKPHAGVKTAGRFALIMTAPNVFRKRNQHLPTTPELHGPARRMNLPMQH